MTTELDRALHKSVMKREAVREREVSAAMAKADEEFLLGVGATDMTPAELKKLIDSDKRMYYRTEELNDKLYIQYKGWKEIKSLEGWTGLKALYAENNAFSKIEGLQMCRKLRSLFLSENCISKIEGLENCPELWTLNLANNFITKVEGISHLKNLNTLNLAKNKLGCSGWDDLIGLIDTPIHCLDIQGNRIDDPDVLPEVFMQMPELRVIYLKDNPCCKKIISYRKNLTVYCKQLKYIDDRPVFDDDRRAAMAYNRGGLEEERAERRRIKQEERDRHERNMKRFQEMIEMARAEKRERDAMQVEDKYANEDDDPVDTHEKRMKRQYANWKEEHKEELRDEVQDRADAIIKAEKEEREKGVKEEPPPPVESPLFQESDDPSEKKKKEDNRKLVYEDIWDDTPSTMSKATGSTAPAGNSSVKSDADQTSMSSSLDDVRPSMSAARQRAEEIQRKTEEVQQQAVAQADEERRGSWYEKYRNKMDKVKIKLESNLPEVKKASGQAEALRKASDTEEAKARMQSMGIVDWDTLVEEEGHSEAAPAAAGNSSPSRSASEAPTDAAVGDQGSKVAPASKASSFQPPPRTAVAAPAAVTPAVNELEEMD